MHAVVVGRRSLFGLFILDAQTAVSRVDLLRRNFSSAI